MSSESSIVESAADTKSASNDDPTRDLKMEEEKKQDETVEEMLPEETSEEDSDEEMEICRSCAKLETMKLEHMPGDEVYGCKLNDFDDEREMLRMIYYLRSVDQSGGFYVECPPPGYIGGIYNRAHFPCMNFFRKAKLAARRVVDTYNNSHRQGTKKLEYKGLTNVTGGRSGLYRIFYLTIEALDLEKGETEDYHAVISYSVADRSFDKVDIFRRSNGEDLLDPDSYFAKRTMPGRWSGKNKQEYS
ncbi:hypothetical protein LINGRAHAP2_LOCUS12175 [Linum grandiflorum]